MKFRTIFVLLCFSIFLIGCGRSDSPGTKKKKDDRPYSEQRNDFETKLTVKKPSFQEWEEDECPENVREVKFPSGELSLRAWVYVPENDENRKRPALVFCHGGFASSPDFLYGLGPFIEEDFVIMVPAWRGENGNPGYLEMMYGEVDDAANAVKWLSEQPYVDSEHIYMFGHSIGGGISAVVSLMDDIPLRHSGSSGGLYDVQTFREWKKDMPKEFPFDPKDKTECNMRLLEGNLGSMQREHYAYIGKEDYSFHPNIKRLERENKKEDGKLSIEQVPGDHFSCLSDSLRKYLEIVKKDFRAPRH